MNDSHDEKQERWLADDAGAEQHGDFESAALADEKLADEAYAALELSAALAEAAAVQPERAVVPERFIAPRRIVATRRWAWAGGLMAAVLAFVLLMPQGEGPGGESLLRQRGAGDAGAAIGVAPKGELGHVPGQFSWHPADTTRTSRFRWELYDAQARRRAFAVVADSVLVRPAHETPADSVGIWRWLVIELKADGREGATSAAVEFTVTPKGMK